MKLLKLLVVAARDDPFDGPVAPDKVFSIVGRYLADRSQQVHNFLRVVLVALRLELVHVRLALHDQIRLLQEAADVLGALLLTPRQQQVAVPFETCNLHVVKLAALIIDKQQHVGGLRTEAQPVLQVERVLPQEGGLAVQDVH